MALPHGKRIWAGMSLLLSTLGLVVVVMAAQGPQNIFSRAWSGFQADLANLGLVQLPNPNPLSSLPATASAQTLFHQLTQVYWDAQVQNIEVPEFSVKGVAFLKYDPNLNRTFIFTRLVNLPLVPDKAIRLWLAKDISTYTKAGIAQPVAENEDVVFYSVFSGSGDLRNYQELLFSYDSLSADIDKPELVVLSLNL